MKDITVLVNSCDKYKDAWEPFFRLLHIQWQDLPYNVVLNTETLSYECDFMNVRTINSSKGIPWAKRLRHVLENIDTEFILYTLEDFFFDRPVNVSAFEEAHQLIKNDASIGYIGLRYNRQLVFKDESNADRNARFVSKDELVVVNRVNSQTALWRRKWLLSLLRDHETPWEFEMYASIRSRRTDKKVLIINNTNEIMPPVFSYGLDPKDGLGIYGGKFLHKNRELFEKYGIKANFDNLGIVEDPAKSSYGQTSNISAKPIKTNNLHESLYSIKRAFKHAKKTLRKQFRKIKSLI